MYHDVIPGISGCYLLLVSVRVIITHIRPISPSDSEIAFKTRITYD